HPRADGAVLPCGGRVVNMPSNAAVGGVVPPALDWPDVISIEKDATTGTTSGYSASVAAASKLLVCPAYLFWCLAPAVISDDAAKAHMASCTGGAEATWRLQQTITSRIADRSKSTTFYIVGDAKALSADMMSLVDPANGFGVTIVIVPDNLSD